MIISACEIMRHGYSCFVFLSFLIFLQCPCDTSAGFLNFGAIDFFGPDNSLLWEALLCGIGHLAAFLNSTHQMQVAPLVVITKSVFKLLQISPGGSKLPPVENHYISIIDNTKNNNNKHFQSLCQTLFPLLQEYYLVDLDNRLRWVLLLYPFYL